MALRSTPQTFSGHHKALLKLSAMFKKENKTFRSCITITTYIGVQVSMGIYGNIKCISKYWTAVLSGLYSSVPLSFLMRTKTVGL